MKLIWGLVILKSALLMGMDPNTPNKAKHDLKSALGDEYHVGQKIALQLPFVIKDTCYKSFQVTDPCATLLKLLIHVEKFPSEINNPVVIENIKKNTAAIAQARRLSPQTTNELVRGVLNKNPKHRYDAADWLPTYNWEEQINIKRLYEQFPTYLKEFCFAPVHEFRIDQTCYQLVLLFYGLSPYRDKNGAYHQNKPLIKETIKKIKLDCFKSGLYTNKQLVADFVKAGESSSVD
jgi:hypothetical protein